MKMTKSGNDVRYLPQIGADKQDRIVKEKPIDEIFKEMGLTRDSVFAMREMGYIGLIWAAGLMRFARLAVMNICRLFSSVKQKWWLKKRIPRSGMQPLAR